MVNSVTLSCRCIFITIAHITFRLDLLLFRPAFLAESFGRKDFLLQEKHQVQNLPGLVEQERGGGGGVGDPDGDARPQ